MKGTAIKIDKVSKDFSLTSSRANTIKSLLTGFHKDSATEKNTQHALKNISFEVKEGEFFGIVGRNGSGKSTLLKILAGIYQPTKGSTSVNGKLVPFIELGVGFNPELTGRENVYMNGALLGFSESEVESFYDEVVEFAELEKFMDKKLKNYSSGMQVRLAFSMAIRANANVLLIDEVLAVGDADFQRKCFDYFRKLKKESTTVVFVSHNMDAIREYCDRAILIDKSELVFEGTAHEVAGEYSKLFLQSGTRNKSEVSEDRWGDGTATFKAPRLTKTDSKIDISFKIKSEERIEAPVIGYYFTNSQGQQICGSNTQILGVKVDAFEPKQSYSVCVSMENIFSDGDYSVTLALLHESGAAISDWWVNAASMSVNKMSHVPYMVDLPASVTIKEV